MSQLPEWKTEVHVVTRGNQKPLRNLEQMCIATRAKETIYWYIKKPCRFIYNTTGPKGVAKYLKDIGYEPTIIFLYVQAYQESLSPVVHI